jgi:hypothetical protein
MLVQKYPEACAKAKLAVQSLKDPHHKLTESETRAIVRKVAEILGLNMERSEPFQFEPRRSERQTTEDGGRMSEGEEDR